MMWCAVKITAARSGPSKTIWQRNNGPAGRGNGKAVSSAISLRRRSSCPVGSLIEERSVTGIAIFCAGAIFITRPVSSKLARSASCRSTRRSMARAIFSIEMLPVKRTVMDSL